MIYVVTVKHEGCREPWCNGEVRSRHRKLEIARIYATALVSHGAAPKDVAIYQGHNHHVALNTCLSVAGFRRLEP